MEVGIPHHIITAWNYDLELVSALHQSDAKKWLKTATQCGLDAVNDALDSTCVMEIQQGDRHLERHLLLLHEIPGEGHPESIRFLAEIRLTKRNFIFLFSREQQWHVFSEVYGVKGHSWQKYVLFKHQVKQVP